MSDFGQNLRQGFRQLAKTPGVTVISLTALALGIGANSAIFSVVNQVLLTRLPVQEPDRLVLISHFLPARKISSGMSQYADAVAWRGQVKSLESVGAMVTQAMSLSAGDDPERVIVGKADAAFLPMLGLPPVAGRLFLPDDDKPGGPKVAVLTFELWRRRFGANPGVIGRAVALDGVPHHVVGVLPEGFRWVGRRPEAFVPLQATGTRGARGEAVAVYGRMRAGVSREQLNAELELATAALNRVEPRHKDWKLVGEDIRDYIVTDVRVTLWVLLGAVALVVLIACANVANLLLARGAVRRREMAVRLALGAHRKQLVWQLFVESLPLGAIGSALGLVLAWWGVRLLPLLQTERVPRLAETRLDATVLLYTLAVSVLSCLLFSLAPAFSLAKTGLNEAMRPGQGTRAGRLRSSLVALEVALAVMLVIGAGLLMRTFFALASVQPGFRPDGLLTATIEQPRARFRTPEDPVAFYQAIRGKLAALPGVRAASVTSSLPLGGNYFRGEFRFEGTDQRAPLNYRAVDHLYLKTFEVPLLRGRFFEESDRLGTEPVAVINDVTARKFWPKEDALGKRMTIADKTLTVIGVIPNLKHMDVSNGDENEVLLPWAQMPTAYVAVALRVEAGVYREPMQLAPAMRRAVAEVEPNQAVAQVATMEHIMADRLSPRRLTMVLLLVFAGVALVLAAAGIYGVLSFSVQSRTKEIGVRFALGAGEGNVVRLVVRQALILAGAGAVAGVVLAAALTRFVESILFGVKALDPRLYLAAAVVLFAVAVLSAWLPARRAAGIQPSSALRHE
ncbi:MAG: ABC transporter permease [Bryobacteraceae bacterium]|nr:ABC transporter permease [Bryobacteraceae bacterium]